MKDGFVPVCAITPHIRVADVTFNVNACAQVIDHAISKGARVVVLPELCLCGYTCEDLFLQTKLLAAAEQGVADLARRFAHESSLIVVGAPLRVFSKLYNCAFVLNGGKVLGVVPKQVIPTYNEFYEGRHFVPGPSKPVYIDVAGFSHVPFGANQLFAAEETPELVVAVEICEDLWAPNPPSIAHARAGATLVCNLSASNELVGKEDYRRTLVAGQSARLVCAYAYADAGWGESTTDLVFAAHNLVCENGTILDESKPFASGMAISQIDVGLLATERQRLTSFPAPADGAVGSAAVNGVGGYEEGALGATVKDVTHLFSTHLITRFHLDASKVKLTRMVDPYPFVPSERAHRNRRCEKIFAIQVHGLAKRLEHTNSKKVVVGISGGLDSTLALLVCARAFDMLDRSREDIVAITMPGFGTTSRTKGNAALLAEGLGATLRTIDITAAVRQHFADIGQAEAVHDVTYENAQARERTQILMDVANKEGGLVVGTGDLSELALGWATYNGDHMSMYAVNAGVPKTLVRHLVRYVADTCGNTAIERVLLDVLATPVSPELLPSEGDDTIAQRTEDLVGPYELHDFFLYQMLRHGFTPSKILRLAEVAFDGQHGADAYGRAEILPWLKVFYRRFFAQQFKRSCLPDGPKVGSIAVSPRGDLRMPSDACATLWMRELDELK